MAQARRGAQSTLSSQEAPIERKRLKMFCRIKETHVYDAPIAAGMRPYPILTFAAAFFRTAKAAFRHKQHGTAAAAARHKQDDADEGIPGASYVKWASSKAGSVRPQDGAVCNKRSLRRCMRRESRLALGTHRG